MGEPQSILVCRTDRMGDVILALPAARALKLTYPDARVVFLCRQYTAPLVAMCPWLDGLITVDRDGREVLEEIRRYGFDAAVCLWHHPRVVRLLAQARIPLRVGSGTRIQSLRFHRRLFEHRKFGLRNEVYYNLNIAMRLGIRGIPDPLWRWEIPVDAATRVHALLAELGISQDSKPVVLHPGSGESAREWQLTQFAGLTRHLRAQGQQVLLTGAAEEHGALEEVSRLAGGIPTLAGKLTIPELAALVKRSALVVANSTGPLHLANSLGTPVIGLYPLDRSMHPRRWGPLGQLDHVLTPESPNHGMDSIAVGRAGQMADHIVRSGKLPTAARWHQKPTLSVLITITDPWWNAAAYLAIGLAAGLRARGHQVWVMGRPGTPALARAADQAIPTFGLPLQRQDPVSVAWNILRIRSILRTLPFTLVNAHCPMGHSQVAAALFGMGRNTLIIRTVCDPRTPYRNMANRWLLQRATDAIIVTCEASRQRYIGTIQALDQKTTVIPGGIDPSPFLDIARKARPENGEDVLFGVVSRLSPVKGHEIFLRAAAKVAARLPRTRFLISGEKAQITHQDLRQLGASLGIAHRIEFLDRVEDVRELLTELDVGVVPSAGSEAMCRIALEMMAAGLPVIGTSVNAIGETILDGVTGMVVPPDDPDVMAQAMIKLASDPRLRLQMGQAGRARIVHDLSLDSMVERTEEIYREVLSKRTSEHLPVIREAV